MEKTILTPQQLKFLELAASKRQITKRFYLTGGTALAEFFLHHRLSQDLDFFCEAEEVSPMVVEPFLKSVSYQLNIVKINRTQFLGLFSYELVFKDGQKLKVDFNYYPFLRINRGLKFKDLEIDSLYDIAVNKLHTIFMKPRSRDYLDLYFIMQKEDFSLRRLILDAKAKFDWDIDRINLASQFVRIKDLQIQDFPKMLKPFNRKDMEDFFVSLAKSLEGEIFKK